MQTQLLRISKFILLVTGMSCETIRDRALEYYSLSSSHKSRTIEGTPRVDIIDSSGKITMKFVFWKNTREQKRIKVFVRKGDRYFEQKLIGDLDNKIVDTAFVLAFARQDTSFEYRYDYKKYPPSWPEGWDGWKYQTEKIKDNRLRLTKRHLKDSTFVETYEFDPTFHMEKIGLYYGSDTLIFSN